MLAASPTTNTRNVLELTSSPPSHAYYLPGNRLQPQTMWDQTGFGSSTNCPTNSCYCAVTAASRPANPTSSASSTAAQLLMTSLCSKVIKVNYCAGEVFPWRERGRDIRDDGGGHSSCAPLGRLMVPRRMVGTESCQPGSSVTVMFKEGSGIKTG